MLFFVFLISHSGSLQNRVGMCSSSWKQGCLFFLSITVSMGMITQQRKTAKWCGGREVFSEVHRMSDTDTGCNTGNSSEVLGNQFSQ